MPTCSEQIDASSLRRRTTATDGAVTAANVGGGKAAQRRVRLIAQLKKYDPQLPPERCAELDHEQFRRKRRW